MKTYVLLILVALLFNGCATQRYGRMQNVTEAEKKTITCENIEVEIQKAQEFVKTTTDKDNEFTGRDVLGFLGDFGIGNHMEYSDAIQSGTDRVAQLNTLKSEKNCGSSANIDKSS